MLFRYNLCKNNVLYFLRDKARTKKEIIKKFEIHNEWLVDWKLDELLELGLVEQQGNKYHITAEGRKEILDYNPIGVKI